ncbi:MAG: ribonuclease HII [Candidatus Aegiribacteria sp.]|nr:ribonuclease HII [Candidatus Aegiribacteria sp.]
MNLHLFDENFRSKYPVFAGIDEAGRGPHAGPLIAAAVMFPPDTVLKGVNDSKKLSDSKRRQLFPVIIEESKYFSTGIVESTEIDTVGMAEAVRLSFTRTAGALGIPVDLFLIDGLPVKNLNIPAEFIVKGDSKSLSIAAASIIAKVTRDDIMIEADRKYPGYGFASNKGYGTKDHIKAISKLGPSPIHRMSFAPMKNDIQLRFRFE